MLSYVMIDEGPSYPYGAYVQLPGSAPANVQTLGLGAPRASTPIAISSDAAATIQATAAIYGGDLVRVSVSDTASGSKLQLIEPSPAHRHPFLFGGVALILGSIGGFFLGQYLAK